MVTVPAKKLRKLTHKQQVCFAIFCAEQVTHLLCDKTREPALKAIETAKLWLEDKASKKECKEVAHAATYTATYSSYATYAAADAAYVVANSTIAHANAAYTANHAASATGNKKEIVEAQWAFYRELLEFDEIFEREVL